MESSPALFLYFNQLITDTMEKHPYLDYNTATRVATGAIPLPFRFNKVNPQDQDMLDAGGSTNA